jgi:hypothetical protein
LRCAALSWGVLCCAMLCCAAAAAQCTSLPATGTNGVTSWPSCQVPAAAGATCSPGCTSGTPTGVATCSAGSWDVSTASCAGKFGVSGRSSLHPHPLGVVVAWCCDVMCCAWLSCTVLSCTVLCCAVLCCAVLCCAMLCCAVLCCAVLCCAVLCCAVRAVLC